MKPSERIEQLKKLINVADPLGGLMGFGTKNTDVEAIIKYLDENAPCEHKSAYQVDSSIGDVFYNVCNDCGILFLAKSHE